jgi:Zn-dependent peptidase ImmA (M78 family)
MINTLDQAESLATKLRIFFTIPIDAPITNLIYLLESNGMMIITIPKDEITKHFKGFYETVSNVPIISVLESDNGYDQRFSVAKFLGELLIVAGDNKDELTTRFAESLLIPKQALINEFGSSRQNININEIRIFSNIYKVSYKNILKRLTEAKIITPSNEKYSNIYINKNNIKEQIFIEQANNYDKMLYKLYALGLIKDLTKYE